GASTSLPAVELGAFGPIDSWSHEGAASAPSATPSQLPRASVDDAPSAVPTAPAPDEGGRASSPALSVPRSVVALVEPPDIAKGAAPSTPFVCPLSCCLAQEVLAQDKPAQTATAHLDAQPE